MHYPETPLDAEIHAQAGQILSGGAVRTTGLSGGYTTTTTNVVPATTYAYTSSAPTTYVTGGETVTYTTGPAYVSGG